METVAYVLGTESYPFVIGSIRVTDEHGFTKLSIDIKLPERGLYKIEIRSTEAGDNGELFAFDDNWLPPLIAGNGRCKMILYTKDFKVCNILDARVRLYRVYDSLHNYIFGVSENLVAEGFFRKISEGKNYYSETCGEEV